MAKSLPTPTPTPWMIASENGWDVVVAKGHRYGVPVLRLAENNPANADFICRAVNAHDDLVAALTDILEKISYVNIHGVGREPTHVDGLPQIVSLTPEEFWQLFRKIGVDAAAALKKADGER